MYQTFKKIIPLIILILIVVSIFSPLVAQAASAGSISAGSACGNTGLTHVGNDLLCTFYEIAASISYAALTIAAWAVALAGLLFDTIMNYTVVQMKANLALSFINEGWADIRDLGNLIFIFIAIYLGIQEIIGFNGGKVKRLMRNLIIVGLLVNFSLFFTQLLIDASNILTISFYNMILHIIGPTNTSFSTVFVRALGLTSIYGVPMLSTSSISSLAHLGLFQILIVGIGGSVFFIIVAITLFTAALLFVIRFVLFIFLMILSPVAFLFSVVPGRLQEISKQWWETLSGQLLFAPLYVILVFVVAMLLYSGHITASNLASAFTGQLSPQLTGANATLNSITTPPTTATFGACASNSNSCSAFDQIFFFILIIALMNAALLIAVKYASQGASIAGKAAGWASGAVNGSFKFGGTLVGRGATFAGGLAGRGAASVTGRAGRRVIGGTAAKLLSDESVAGQKLRDLRQSKLGIVRGLAKVTTAGIEQTSKASFDFRNTQTVKKLSEKSGMKFGKGRGEGGRIKEIERGAEELEKEYAAGGGASQESVMRLRNTRFNKQNAGRQLAVAERNAQALRSEEAKIRATIENENRGATGEDREKVEAEIKERIKKFREDGFVGNKKVSEILKARNDALTNYRNADKEMKAAQKSIQQEKEAKQIAFAIRQRERAHRFGGMNPTSILGGKSAASYDKAVENMATHKKTKKDDEKIDENKEQAEIIGADLQTAIDANDKDRIEEITKNTKFKVFEHISPNILNDKTVIKTLAKTKRGLQFLKSSAATPKQYENIEKILNEQTNTP